MQIDEITKKAIQIMQSIYSLGKISKKLIPLNKEFETGSPVEYFHVPDFYPIIYEDTICKVIELSILLRREKEYLESIGEKISKKVKYSNVGKNVVTNVDVAFDDALSKIIHSKQIYLQVKDIEGTIGFSYDTDRNCGFTGILRIVTEGNDKVTIFTIDIDLEKFCTDAMMINAKTTY